MIQNCRNCRFAVWGRSPSGRRNFNNWAPCTYDTKQLKLPAAQYIAIRELQREHVAVASYGTANIACEVWEKG